jgi:signal transduction histidine kinase
MTARDTNEIFRTVVRTDSDVLALRRKAREAAERVGLDAQDQVRVATALSEVGRHASASGGGTVSGTVRQGAQGSVLVITVTTTLVMPVDGPVSEGGVAAARRLLDRVEVTLGPPTEVVLSKGLPERVSHGSIEAVRAALDSVHPPDAVAEMRAQNAELVRTLDALTDESRKLEVANAELAQLNDELEETNRGVLAMYHQLSDELEETNTGVVALYAELDERGRQLSAANEAKTRFLRNVSHELRTPVNSILGLVSLLADSPLDGEQHRQVSFLQDSAAALLRLVNELLDLARAESGRQAVEVTDVDLVALLDELHGTLEPLARDGVRLEIEPPPRQRLRSDRNLLARVLRNLLTNAVKFTDQGHVRLTVSEQGDRVLFAVEDTGLGIEPEHLSTVFEEFFQIPNRLQPTVRGTGLGLPYARRTAEALGGTLDVTSTVGQGSTFTLALPVAGPSPSAAGDLLETGQRDEHVLPTPAVPAADDGTPVAEHILVVDDDDAYRAVVMDLVRDMAGRTTEAATVKDAVKIACETGPDVVVLDVRMPDLDGVEGLVRLRAFRPGYPVVLMSSAPPPPLPPGSQDVPFLSKAALDRSKLRTALRAALGSSGGEAVQR